MRQAQEVGFKRTTPNLSRRHCHSGLRAISGGCGGSRARMVLLLLLQVVGMVVLAKLLLLLLVVAALRMLRLLLLGGMMVTTTTKRGGRDRRGRLLLLLLKLGLQVGRRVKVAALVAGASAFDKVHANGDQAFIGIALHMNRLVGKATFSLGSLAVTALELAADLPRTEQNATPPEKERTQTMRRCEGGRNKKEQQVSNVFL